MEKVVNGSKFSKLSFWVKLWVLADGIFSLALIILAFFCLKGYFDLANEMNVMFGSELDFSIILLLIAVVLFIMGCVYLLYFINKVRKREWSKLLWNFISS